MRGIFQTSSRLEPRAPRSRPQLRSRQLPRRALCRGHTAAGAPARLRLPTMPSFASFSGSVILRTDNFEKPPRFCIHFSRAPRRSSAALRLGYGTRSNAAVRDCADIFRRLLEQNASNPAVHLLLGQAYAQQEDFCGRPRGVENCIASLIRGFTEPTISRASSTFVKAISNRRLLSFAPSWKFTRPIWSPATSWLHASLGGPRGAGGALLREVVRAKPIMKWPNSNWPRTPATRRCRWRHRSLEAAKSFRPTATLRTFNSVKRTAALAACRRHNRRSRPIKTH